MKSTAITSLLFLALAVAVGGYILERWALAERDRLKERIAMLEQMQGSARRPHRTMTPPQPASAKPGIAPDAVYPRMDADSKEEIGTSAAGSLSDITGYFEHTFRMEPVDPTWGPQTERELRGHIDNIMPSGSAVIGLVCKSSFCRLETEHDSKWQHNELFGILYEPDQASFVGRFSDAAHSSVGERAPNGRLRYVLYMRRKGSDASMIPDWMRE